MNVVLCRSFTSSHPAVRLQSASSIVNSSAAILIRSSFVYCGSAPFPPVGPVGVVKNYGFGAAAAHRRHQRMDEMRRSADRGGPIRQSSEPKGRNRGPATSKQNINEMKRKKAKYANITIELGLISYSGAQSSRMTKEKRSLLIFY